MSYLRWTSVWVAAATRVLGDDGSLFLNVGNKPTQPWTAIDVVLEARRHLILQNTIHWIKSIVIDRELAGARAGLERDLAVGHYKPINSERFLNDCHEFVFHLTPRGRTPLDRRAIGVPYQHTSNVGRWQAASEGPLPRQQLVHPLHHDSEPRARPPASGDLSAVAPPNTAYGFTVCNAPASCCTRSWGSGARPWPAPSSALISLGSKWTGPISMRRWNG